MLNYFQFSAEYKITSNGAFQRNRVTSIEQSPTSFISVIFCFPLHYKNTSNQNSTIKPFSTIKATNNLVMTGFSQDGRQIQSLQVFHSANSWETRFRLCCAIPKVSATWIGFRNKLKTTATQLLWISVDSAFYLLQVKVRCSVIRQITHFKLLIGATLAWIKSHVLYFDSEPLP